MRSPATASARLGTEPRAPSRTIPCDRTKAMAFFGVTTSLSFGAMINLGTLPGMYSSVANGINDAGQVVGRADEFPGNLSRAFLYQNGTMIDLGTLPGMYHSDATGDI